VIFCPLFSANTHESLPQVISAVYNSDPEQHEKSANLFFEQFGKSNHMEIINKEYSTSLRFVHINDNYEWGEHCGYIDDGQIQIGVAGEIEVEHVRQGVSDYLGEQSKLDLMCLRMSLYITIM
jgi:hypothetical protein